MKNGTTEGTEIQTLRAGRVIWMKTVETV